MTIKVVTHCLTSSSNHCHVGKTQSPSAQQTQQTVNKLSKVINLKQCMQILFMTTATQADRLVMPGHKSDLVLCNSFRQTNLIFLRSKQSL